MIFYDDSELIEAVAGGLLCYESVVTLGSSVIVDYIT